jgi:hypothetical protein
MNQTKNDDMDIDDTDMEMMEIASDAYENGISCLNLLRWLLKQEFLSDMEKANFAMHYEKIKAEYRCEKMLMLCLLREPFASLRFP